MLYIVEGIERSPSVQIFHVRIPRKIEVAPVKSSWIRYTVITGSIYTRDISFKLIQAHSHDTGSKLNRAIYVTHITTANPGSYRTDCILSLQC
jgi:hypothetical protein